MAYVLDLYNYFEVLSIYLNISLMYNHVFHHNQSTWLTTELGHQTVVSFAVWLMWFEVLYFLRLFESFSFYIRLIV